MKVLYLVTVSLILYSTTNLIAQPYLEWEAQYSSNSPVGIDRGHVITSDDDGNVYVAGKVQGNGNFDYITIKYNKYGQTKWVKTYNGTGNGDDEVNAISIDENRNVVVTGQSYGASNSDIVTIKYDSIGNEIFLKRYDNSISFEAGVAVILDNFGNIFVGGTSNAYAILLKYNYLGDLLWSKNFDSGVCNKLIINNLNNLIVCNSVGLEYAYEIYELNISSGQLLYTYNTNSNYNARDRGIVDKIVCDQSNNFYVLATADNLINNVAPVIANFTKYSHFVGLESWEYEIQDYRVQGKDIIIDDSLNIYFLVERTNSNGRKKSFVAKIATTGNYIWEKDYQSNTNLDYTPNRLAFSSNFTESEKYLLYTSNDSNGSLNLNSVSIQNGSPLSTILYNCSTQGTVISNDVYSERCKKIYITGYSICKSSSQDILTLKYSTILKPKITPSKQNPICENEAIILYADTCSTCSYVWSNGGIGDSILINPDTTTEYQVTVTNSKGCEVVSLPYKVIVKKLLKPEITITPSANSICVGTGTTVMAQSINAGANPGYTWHVNGTQQAGQNSASLPISPLINAQVQCILTTSEQCYVQQKDTSNTITVTVNPLPLASITALGNTTFCSGNQVLLTSSQATSYLWSTGSTADTITATESGKYKVTITDTNGCSNVSNEITVTVNALPSANIMSSGSSTFCSGDSVILTASSAGIYLWSNGATDNQIVVKTTGSFNLNITDQNGCQATSQNVNVVVNPLPVVNIMSLGDLNLCQGESETLTSSIAGNLYNWSNGQSTPSITVTENGTYQLSVTDANGCQGVASPVTITVHALPVVSINSSGPVTFCQGNDVILTANNASSYLWSNGITTQSTTINSSGSYLVMVTDANGCRNSSSPITINVNPLPSASISPTGTAHICMGDSLKLVASGGTQYLWSSTQTNKEIVIKESASYLVTITDANGCSAISSPTTIVVDTLPNIVVNVIGTLQFCDGDSVVLEALNAANYVWNNGANSHKITIKNSGSFNVTGTNSYGCKSISTIFTSEKQALVTPKVEISTPDLSVCEGAVVTFNTNTIGGGNEPSYQWFVNSIPQTSNSPTYVTNSLSNGSSIYCILTSSEKCVTASSDKSNVLNIAVNALKTPTIEIIQESAEIFECEDGVFKAQVSNGGSNPKLKWFVNDIHVASGVTFTYREFIQGDKVNCLLESNAECLTTNNVISNTLYPTVTKKLQPSITIIDGKIQSTNYSTNKYTYKWFLNGVEISTDEIIECAEFGPGEYYLEVSINECTFPSQSKQIDNCTVATKDINSKEAIIVYPNPTRGIIQLKKGEGINEEFQIRITNLLGTEVLEAKSSQFGTVDVSSLEAGVYFLTLNKINVIKIIKI